MEDAFADIRLRDLAFFDRLAALGSITATARELGIPKPTASRWLAVLERRVGQPLVHRTTRHVALSERGVAFHARVKEVLASVRAARLVAQSDEPSGTLRVSVPVPLGRIVGGSVIAAFRRRLPGVRLEIALDNTRIDLVRDGFDLAIRGGALPDSAMIGRRLATVAMRVYVSVTFDGAPCEEVPFIAAPGDETLVATGAPRLGPAAVVVDDRSAVADALVAGAGLGVLPEFLGEPGRAEGRLERLDETVLAKMPVHALYLPAQRDDPRLQTLVETVESQLRRTIQPK